MELSENTLSVLRNFSSINQNIMFRQGNVLKTISEARNVLASAPLDVDFPQDFGIYDLNEFIGVLGLVDTPRLKFNDEYVEVGDQSGRSKIKYFFSPEETLTSPQKDIKMPEAEIKFTLDNDTLNKIKRAASTLGHDEVQITGKNGVLSLTVVESQNSTSNAFTIDIDGEFPDTDFKFILGINNLKIIPGDYEVQVSSKLISNFRNKELDVQYWIALEKSSTFGA